MTTKIRLSEAATVRAGRGAVDGALLHDDRRRPARDQKPGPARIRPWRRERNVKIGRSRQSRRATTGRVRWRFDQTPHADERAERDQRLWPKALC